MNDNNPNLNGAAAATEVTPEDNDKNINDIFDFLGESFLKDYEEIEVASNLPDATYTMVVTKSEVVPRNLPSTGNTVNLKLTAKVLTPTNLAGKVFQDDFILNENNRTMMKKRFYALGFEFDLRNQFAAFARLKGSEIEVVISTNGNYQNKNIRRITQPAELLTAFLANLGETETI